MGLTVQFCWVPSHCGIRGNEAADAAAAAACHDVVGDFPIPAADHCSAIHRALLVSWQVLWSQEALNKLHSVCPALPFHHFFPSLSRHELSDLARVFIGHTRQTHRFLLAGEPPPACPSCACPLTVHHLLMSCPLYATARSTAFGHYFSIQEPLSLAGLLGDAGRPHLLAVLSFLKACNLFKEF